MHLDPTTPKGAAWIADHLADFDGNVENLLHDETFTCEGCDAVFTEARDVGYGEDDREFLCIDCACERGADARAGRRYGERD